MARLRVDVFSDVLGMSTSMTDPDAVATTTQIGMTGVHRDGPPPVLYLLHGLSDDDTIWLRRTSIERYVAPLGLAVVMPQVHRSFYADEAIGGRYWTFLSEELPEWWRRFFRVSRRREDTFVAGLSMGGYGALKWALRASGPLRCRGEPVRCGRPGVARRRPGVAHALRGDVRRSADRRDTRTTSCGCWRRRSGPADPCPPSMSPVARATRSSSTTARSWPRPRVACRSLTTDFGPGEHDWAYWDRTNPGRARLAAAARCRRSMTATDAR